MQSSLPRSSRRGSASMAALVVCLAGSLGLLGMISIMQARQSSIEASSDRVNRRVRLMNGRQLAKEALYTRVLSSQSGTEFTVSLEDDWGRVTVPAWSSNPYTTDQLSAIWNQTAPSPGLEPFVSSVTTTIHTVVDASSTWSSPESFVCLLNAQNTALAGHLVDARRPASPSSTNSLSGSLVANGRALVFENPAQNNGFAFQATAINAPSPCLAQSGFDVTVPSRPDNLPQLPMPEGIGTSGYTKGDRTGVNASGTLALELMELALETGEAIQAETARESNGIEADGSGVVNITVGDFGLGHTVIQGNLTTLNLIGQANAVEAIAVENLAPVILITNSTTLATVNFTALNHRPLILAHATAETNSSQVIRYVFPSGASFRAFLVQQDANTQFVLSGTAAIQGGLFLDFSTTISGGTLTVSEETNKSFFQLLLPRSAWLESYRQL